MMHGSRMLNLNAVEQEIAGEQASALGITGRKLDSALQAYRQQPGGPSVQRVADAVLELLIQRESLGIPYGNVAWVLRTYDIPQAILTKLGLRDDTRPNVSSAQEPRDMMGTASHHDAEPDIGAGRR